MMTRFCAKCKQPLPLLSYELAEWVKDDGVRRCKACVLAAEPQESGRHNESDSCKFIPGRKHSRFMSSCFLHVEEGKYKGGERDGQDCVGKWLKQGTASSSDEFAFEIKAVDKAQEIVKQYNQIYNPSVPFSINFLPEVLQLQDRGRDACLVLCEPFIEDCHKFNSNSGWYCEYKVYHRLAQAFSHFSYHITAGNYLVCDLQGGFEDEKEIALSSPAILSRTGEFGDTDLGIDGIDNFFMHQLATSTANQVGSNLPTHTMSSLQFQPLP